VISHPFPTQDGFTIWISKPQGHHDTLMMPNTYELVSVCMESIPCQSVWVWEQHNFRRINPKKLSTLKQVNAGPTRTTLMGALCHLYRKLSTRLAWVWLWSATGVVHFLGNLSRSCHTKFHWPLTSSHIHHIDQILRRYHHCPSINERSWIIQLGTRMGSHLLRSSMSFDPGLLRIVIMPIWGTYLLTLLIFPTCLPRNGCLRPTSPSPEHDGSSTTAATPQYLQRVCLHSPSFDGKSSRERIVVPPLSSSHTLKLISCIKI
jgi:hypothetical protein